MVKRTAENMVSEFRYNVESQGIPFETYLQYLGMTVEGMMENYKGAAEKEVKIQLALEKIAELENIEVSDEEVEAEYTAMAERYGVDADTVKKAIQADTVKKELCARKASAIVTDSAVAEAEEAPKAKKKRRDSRRHLLGSLRIWPVYGRTGRSLWRGESGGYCNTDLDGQY